MRQRALRVPACRLLLLAAAVAVAWPPAPARADAPAAALEPKAAIAHSQAAIGRQVGDHRFLDTRRRPVGLADYRGRPLVVSLVYTACEDTCPMITQRLARAVQVAGETFGPEAFAVVTVGFDAPSDTPQRMRAFAREQGVDLPNWRFLSGAPETVEALAADLGFLYQPSGRGFDHMAQTSILDAQGRVYRHVYGANFGAPALVEPLKALALDRSLAEGGLSGLVERVRLFCTFYDPRTGGYRLDYSIVFGLAVGGATLSALAVVLTRAWLRLRRAAAPGARGRKDGAPWTG